jgi:hypothetical protein
MLLSFSHRVGSLRQVMAQKWLLKPESEHQFTSVAGVRDDYPTAPVRLRLRFGSDKRGFLYIQPKSLRESKGEPSEADGTSTRL